MSATQYGPVGFPAEVELRHVMFTLIPVLEQKERQTVTAPVVRIGSYGQVWWAIVDTVHAKPGRSRPLIQRRFAAYILCRHQVNFIDRVDTYRESVQLALQILAAMGDVCISANEPHDVGVGFVAVSEIHAKRGHSRFRSIFHLRAPTTRDTGVAGKCRVQQKRDVVSGSALQDVVQVRKKGFLHVEKRVRTKRNLPQGVLRGMIAVRIVNHSDPDEIKTACLSIREVGLDIRIRQLPDKRKPGFSSNENGFIGECIY